MLNTTPVLLLAVTIHQLGLRTEQHVAQAARHLVERRGEDDGQATTEYALVLLAAALVALLVVAWATAGGGGARVSRLFNRVIDSVIERV
jgi:Flp pilus assembly pilin Flp